MVIFGVLCAAVAIICLVISLNSGCPDCTPKTCNKCSCKPSNITFTCNTCCNECPCDNFKHDITQGFAILFFIVTFFSVALGYIECGRS